MPKRNNKNKWINERWIRFKNLNKIFGLGAITYNYLIGYSIEDKETKSTKECVIKKTKFGNYKNCLDATQLENNVNHLEKYKIHIDSLKKDHKEFIRNSKLMKEIQKRFKSERHVFNEENNKIA